STRSGETTWGTSWACSGMPTTAATASARRTRWALHARHSLRPQTRRLAVPCRRCSASAKAVVFTDAMFTPLETSVPELRVGRYRPHRCLGRPPEAPAQLHPELHTRTNLVLENALQPLAL